MMDICFITDKNYVIATMTAIKSIILNAEKKQQYHIYVLTNGLSDYEEKQILKLKSKNIEITLIDVQNKIPIINCHHKYVSKTSLIKFLLPDIFADLNKILYLDDDIIVKNNLEEFSNISLDDYYAAVVKDINDTLYKYGEKIGVDNYFNSGVMLLNLKKMREDDISNKLLNYKKAEKSSDFMDQNALNFVFNSKVRYLSPIYNYMHTNLEVLNDGIIKEFWQINDIELKEIRKNIIIMHMPNHLKPWKDILSSSFGIYLPYLLKLPHSRLKYDTIKNLYIQNPKRFIKYLLKQNSILRVIINVYENVI